jgi:hypothetical protein
VWVWWSDDPVIQQRVADAFVTLDYLRQPRYSDRQTS